jgi:glutamate/tyrosine decarboxylase-like PLP-dependent enzyme
MDWDEAQWNYAGEKFNQLIAKASTGWKDRRPTPSEDASSIRDRFRDSIPMQGASVDALVSSLEELIPISGFNGHPRWFGYITSSADPIGVLADYFASSINQNSNLWRIAPAATSIELQTLNWIKEIVGFPSESEGIFTSGGQFANLIAHAVTRKTRLPWNVRKDGMGSKPSSIQTPVFYVSDQAHYCHSQALDLLGLGSGSLRLVPVDQDYRMDLNALLRMLDEDRQNGNLPVSVIATAGTVGVGAIDPIRELHRITLEQDLWLHVDGAYGAPGAIATSASEDLRALGLADSLALDPHKWLYAPIDAGVTLIRKPGILSQTFGYQVSYLDQRSAQDGILDFVNFTPENSRPFRALKVWLALKAHGLEGYRTSIERDFQLARYLASLIESSPSLKLAAPVATSIVCWTYVPKDRSRFSDLKDLNQLQLTIMEEIERRGIAFLSKAVLHGGEIAMRACFVNFRTTSQDVEIICEATSEVGAELAGS